MEKTIDSVLASMRTTLEIALRGEADFVDGLDRRAPGIHTAVTSGRSVTFVLQNLKNVAPNFLDWYEPIRDQLSQDAVARYFVDLRNTIEKQGHLGLTMATVDNLHLSHSGLRGQAPAGATGMVIDMYGRSGWEFELPDGTTSIEYFALPSAMGRVSFGLADLPGGMTFEGSLRAWLAQMEDIYLSAVRQFAPDNQALLRVERPRKTTRSDHVERPTGVESTELTWLSKDASDALSAALRAHNDRRR